MRNIQKRSHRKTEDLIASIRVTKPLLEWLDAQAKSERRSRAAIIQNYLGRLYFDATGKMDGFLIMDAKGHYQKDAVAFSTTPYIGAHVSPTSAPPKKPISPDSTEPATTN